MTTTWLGVVTKNVLLLLVVFLPLFLLLAGSLARITGADPHADVIGTALVLYPAFLAPVTVGGALYIACVFAVVARFHAKGRAAALAFVPVIALGFLPFGMGYLFTTLHFVIALILSLGVYGFVVKVPALPQNSTNWPRSTGATLT